MSEIRTGVRSVLSLPAVYELWSQLVGGERARSVFVAEYVRPTPGDRVLDLGCGPGDLLAAIDPDVRYLGVDISEAYIESARRRFGDRATFRIGDAARFDVGGERFDIALATGVIHHLDDAAARRMLTTAAAALADGGRLITLDCALTADQSRVARAIIQRDRGQHVRTPEIYHELAHEAFGDVKPVVRHDLLRMPYTHCIMDCRSPR
jgi:SAM-dependent methyltransferase